MGLLKVDGQLVTVNGKPVDVKVSPSAPYMEADYIVDSREGHLILKAKLYNHTAFMAREFFGQWNLMEVDYSDPSNNITAIEYQAFSSADVTSLQIPSSVQVLFELCFASATASNLVIPPGVTEIPYGAFYNLRSIYSLIDDTELPCTVILPDGITRIGHMAFNNARIDTITIPNAVVEIGEYAFAYCSRLSSIIIPGSATTIGQSAFSNMDNITELTIPASVTSVGNDVCMQCKKLSTLNIQANITEIPDGFAYGTPVMLLTLPDTITTIDSTAFFGHALTSVTIPSGVTSIGQAAFFRMDENALFEVTLLSTTPPTVQQGSFGNSVENITFKVPAESVSVYKTATNWSKWADHIEAIS